MSLKQDISAERIAAKQKELGLWAEPPPCTPWTYSQTKASYPTDPAHVDYRDPNRWDRTRLHEAVVARDLPRVIALLEQGANPWACDRAGRTALDAAQGYSHVAAIESYLEEHMNTVLALCAAYERETGRKLGLRSQRRKSGTAVTARSSDRAAGRTRLQPRQE